MAGRGAIFLKWVNSVSTAFGQNPVQSVTYSQGNGTTPTGAITNVLFGSGDSDSFTYDPNTGRMTQYAFTIGATPQTYTGTLAWNSNGTLNQLKIVDPFNTADTNQVCNYSYDDLTRVSGANCGSAWDQNFNYDAFGNITKTGNDAWAPTYNSAQNQYVDGWLGPNNAVHYDLNGRSLTDGFNTYTWGVWGELASANGNNLTYDAFGRMLENTYASHPEQYLYLGSQGRVLAWAHEQIMDSQYLPLPGGAVAMIGPNGTWQYNHPDWLGSARVFSTTSQTPQSGLA